MSPEREQEMAETGDPSTLAPEICLEIVSTANSQAELAEKRALYREIGAEEVWIVDEDDHIHFFGTNELNSSQLAPSTPNEVHAPSKD